MSSIALTHGGVPDKIKDRQLLDRLVRRVGRHGLGLNDRQIRYLTLAIWICRETDFHPGSTCAHWMSVTAMADKLNCTVRQVHNIECALEQKGLIARTIGSGGRRRGARDAAGKICWVEGIDLGPLLQPVMLDRLLECQEQLEHEELDDDSLVQILRDKLPLKNAFYTFRQLDRVAAVPPGTAKRLAAQAARDENRLGEETPSPEASARKAQ